MDFLDGMNAALNYIEAHLTESIDYDKLSRLTGSSSSQFQRIFPFVTGVPLSEYIRRRKLTRAGFDLQNSSERIIDIAMRYGYDTHESFTRAFSKLHGIAPSQVRLPGAQLKAYPKLIFTVTLKGVTEMNYRIESKPAFKMFGVERIMSTIDGQNFKDIPMFWNEVFENGTFDKLTDATGKQINENHKGLYNIHAVMSYKTVGESTFPYLIGAMVDEKSTTEDFDVIEIPETQWAIFKSDHYSQETLVEVVQTLWKRIFSEWLPTSGYQHAGGAELELYGTDGPNREYCEVWIPVKK